MSKKAETVEGELVRIPHTITTKYFVGQEVFIIYQHQAMRQAIMQIRVEVTDREKLILYYFKLAGQQTPRGMEPFMAPEANVFETQHDLYAALMDL
jgi:hypothetical protein